MIPIIFKQKHIIKIENCYANKCHSGIKSNPPISIGQNTIWNIKHIKCCKINAYSINLSKSKA